MLLLLSEVLDDCYVLVLRTTLLSSASSYSGQNTAAGWQQEWSSGSSRAVAEGRSAAEALRTYRSSELTTINSPSSAVEPAPSPALADVAIVPAALPTVAGRFHPAAWTCPAPGTSPASQAGCHSKLRSHRASTTRRPATPCRFPNQYRSEVALLLSVMGYFRRRPRELKVEDALLYLDQVDRYYYYAPCASLIPWQVKMEFNDKPHIYNEFLEIMKNFKAQS